MGTQACAELGCGVIQDDCLADVDRVACEVNGVVFRHSDSLAGRNARFDNCVGVHVEGCGVVEEVTAFDRAETSVEVIEARIAQMESLHFDVKCSLEIWQSSGA